MSTNEREATLSEKLVQATSSFYALTLRGDLPPTFPITFEDLQKPQPGDFVMENTTRLRRERDGTAFGWLERIVREPCFTEDEWRSQGDDRPIPTERVYYVKNLDGEVVRWVNAEFIVVPNRDWLSAKCEAARRTL